MTKFIILFCLVLLATVSYAGLVTKECEEYTDQMGCLGACCGWKSDNQTCLFGCLYETNCISPTASCGIPLVLAGAFEIFIIALISAIGISIAIIAMIVVAVVVLVAFCIVFGIMGWTIILIKDIVVFLWNKLSKYVLNCVNFGLAFFGRRTAQYDYQQYEEL